MVTDPDLTCAAVAYLAELFKVFAGGLGDVGTIDNYQAVIIIPAFDCFEIVFTHGFGVCCFIVRKISRQSVDCFDQLDVFMQAAADFRQHTASRGKRSVQHICYEFLIRTVQAF